MPSSFGVRRGWWALAPPVLGIPLAILLPNLTPPAASVPLAAERSAYVVGSNDGRIVRVDLDSGTVVPNVATVGSSPNRIETSGDGAWAVIVNSGSDDISVLDLVTESIVGTASLPAGANPWSAEVYGPRVWVSALRKDRVYEVDPGAAAVVDSVPVGKSPEGMATAAGKLYVANTGFDFDDFTYAPGSVTVLDASDLSWVATVPVGLNPQDCIATPDGMVHVVCTGDFYLTSGVVDVLDPATDVVIDSLPVPGYPGGGVAFADGTVHLNVTTPTFASEIRSYDAATRTWIHGESDPLLPSFDFYGNVRVDDIGRILVPDFSQDLLVVENPGAPGSPIAFLVGDGPIDAAFVRREGTVSLAITGISATEAEAGVRLSWRANPGGTARSLVVERRPGGARPEIVARDLDPAGPGSWTDRTAPRGVPLAYRLGVVDVLGEVTWAPAVTIVRRGGEGAGLAIRRVSPNPFRSEVSLPGHVAAAGPGALEIYDVRGRRVVDLAIGTIAAGPGTIRWDGHDRDGRPVAPGFYLARLRVGTSAVTTRLLRAP